MTDIIPAILNWTQSQEQLNTAFEQMFASLLGWGSSLPDPDSVLDGSLFIIMPPALWYQQRAGAWVAI